MNLRIRLLTKTISRPAVADSHALARNFAAITSSRPGFTAILRPFAGTAQDPLNDVCTHVQVICFKACILTFVGREFAQMLQHD